MRTLFYVALNGDMEWWYDGRLHRDGDRPAIECVNGDKFWFINGLLHRDNDMPAVIYGNGTMEWYRHGERYFPNHWETQPLFNDMPGKTCVITLEIILNDSEVCKCDVCSVVSLFGAMNEWLGKNDTCPHCRSPWTNWVKYAN